MPRPKSPDGVLATIERLTDQDPCPDYLREKLNLYLRQDELFPPPPGRRRATPGDKLNPPRTDALVMNVLSLDQVFRSDTKLITRIVNRVAPVEEIAQTVQAAKAEMQRRFDVYGYWLHRLDALQALLTDPDIDLRVTRIDEQIRLATSAADHREPTPFALRAIQRLEASEERGRLGKPSADEYVERAEAYLALRQFALADAQASAALELEPEHAQAWFIRVMVAMRQRQAALGAMRRHQMVAQEIADPMSAHEAWAREMADEAGAEAAGHHDQLAQLLPRALLHWPKLDARRYDYRDQRTQVRDLFIDQLFARLAGTAGGLGSRSRAERNGLGPEWQQQWGDHRFAAGTHDAGGGLLLDDANREAITLLLSERDRDPEWFFDLRDRHFLARDIRLLHLRWMMKLPGYAAHWEEVRCRVAEFPAVTIEENILRDEPLVILWIMHQAMNEGTDGVLAGFDRWSVRRREGDAQQRQGRLLAQYAVFFHHQFARKAFGTCAAIARRAHEHAAKHPRQGYGGSIGHPFDDRVTMPVFQPLYWRYLEALSVVGLTTAGNVLSENDWQLLLDALALREAFGAAQQCFWVESEEYEGGGGEDYPTEPYGVDLRDTAPWLAAVLAARPGAMHDEQRGALDRLTAKLSVAQAGSGPMADAP